jgi:hypothetical protein
MTQRVRTARLDINDFAAEHPAVARQLEHLKNRAALMQQGADDQAVADAAAAAAVEWFAGSPAINSTTRAALLDHLQWWAFHR